MQYKNLNDSEIVIYDNSIIRMEKLRIISP